MKRITFPFLAFIGQEELQLAIILNIINPQLGGLLIKGVKGSGKSTAVYSMVDIMPKIEVMKGCNFNCSPNEPEYWCDDCHKKYHNEKKTIMNDVEVVSIPLSCTEDRLFGNVDVELLLKEGKYRFIPGILAKAHRQILYIDEVNLLPDHIVDDILDVSATGWNHIEREGFSISHPSKFLLVGTMNPEEGELRPQILDRFPLSVFVSSVIDENLRKEIIRRNIAFEKNPSDFRKEFVEETKNMKNVIAFARDFLKEVEVDSYYYDIVVKFCSENKVDGHRPDITIIKTASTHAALEMRKNVEFRHILQAAKFVLKHRTREGGLLKPLTDQEIAESLTNIAEKVKRHPSGEKREVGINKNISLFSENGIVQLEKK